MLLRQARKEQELTQAQMAKKLNFKSIFSYQKLESSRYANPTIETIAKLKEVLPNLRVDLIF